ncbi:hypothetical protein [Skermania sp. ID1734]|uniref:hypothetical protein n=1 Tax=Skermania sp. ID1734 TaxID=2597516 RepID=UPI00351BB03F
MPTVDQLNQELQKAFDPNVPLQEKVDMVQGAQADPELINRVAEAAKKAGVTVVVTKVNDLGNSVTADANLTINGQVNPAVVPFVAEDGRWKLEKGWACNMVNLAQLSSPACGQ